MSQILELKKVLLPGVCAALLLSACGSSSSSTEVKGGTPELKAGTFLGEVTYTNETPPVYGFMLLSATGNFTFILGPDSITSGTLTFNGPVIEGSVVEYELIDTWNRSTGSIIGKVTSNGSALLDTGGLVDKIEINRDSETSDQSLSFSQIAGIYGTTGSDTQITIDVDGGINGVDRGCIIQGQVTIPAAQINIYELSYDASGCTSLDEATGSQRDGEYSGLGTFVPGADSAGDEEIEFAANNGKVAFYFVGTE